MRLKEKAILVAHKQHGTDKRKGTDTLYITHPIEVGLILEKMNCSDETVIAGILHDTLEDTAYTDEALKAEFGQSVLDIVKGCSEPSKKLSWITRKKHTCEYLKTAPKEVRAVSLADKLQNILSIKADFDILGDDLWERFNAGKHHQAWYYKELIKSLKPTTDDFPGYVAIYNEYKEVVEEVFKWENKPNVERNRKLVIMPEENSENCEE
ncbi:MAG: HD domain-containing protein [Desulfitobacteriia bacterium]|jgi:(p)ppGpp synthase/HD superfamily hydrolase